MSEKIPEQIETYPEGSVPDMSMHPDGLVYELKGEKIEVCYWIRYPSYDFIFGTPHKSSKYNEKEVGFFQFRNTKNPEAKPMAIYVDCAELEELTTGFSRLSEVSKLMQPKLWKIHQYKKELEKMGNKLNTQATTRTMPRLKRYKLKLMNGLKSLTKIWR